MMLILILACKIEQEVVVGDGICKNEPVERSFTFFIKSDQRLLTKGLIQSYVDFSMNHLKDLYSAKNLRLSSISQADMFTSGLNLTKEKGFSYTFTSYDQEM